MPAIIKSKSMAVQAPSSPALHKSAPPDWPPRIVEGQDLTGEALDKEGGKSLLQPLATTAGRQAFQTAANLENRDGGDGQSLAAPLSRNQARTEAGGMWSHQGRNHVRVQNDHDRETRISAKSRAGARRTSRGPRSSSTPFSGPKSRSARSARLGRAAVASLGLVLQEPAYISLQGKAFLRGADPQGVLGGIG